MNQLSLPQLTRQSAALKTEANADDERFLGFSIGDNFDALIPLVNLQATIKISLSEILPVPEMKDSLLGIVNYGGKATWVVDLAHLMGAPHYTDRAPQQSFGMGMLFQVRDEMVALLVKKVSTIETYNPKQCLQIGDAMFPDRVRTFLSGYFIDLQQQSWVVIDLDRTIDSILN